MNMQDTVQFNVSFNCDDKENFLHCIDVAFQIKNSLFDKFDYMDCYININYKHNNSSCVYTNIKYDKEFDGLFWEYVWYEHVYPRYKKLKEIV